MPYWSVWKYSTRFHADSLLLMPVSVAFLSKTLIAVLAHERAKTTVHADVIHDIAEFGKGIPARGAH